MNHLELNGALCKVPVLRRTPLGREICDLLHVMAGFADGTEYETGPPGMPKTKGKRDAQTNTDIIFDKYKHYIDTC